MTTRPKAETRPSPSRAMPRLALGLLALGLAAPPAAAQFPSVLDEPDVAIPDNSAGGVQTSISITTSSFITGMQVMLRTDHQDTGQLEVELEHVNTGTKVVLLSIIGATSPPFGAENRGMWINLSDDGFTTIDTADLDFVPPASIEGSFRPDEALSAFSGETTLGTWTLTVRDLVLGVEGSLAAWSISFNSPWTDMGQGLPGSSSTSILQCAGDLLPLSLYSVSIIDAEPSVNGILFVGFDLLPYPTPFKDGFFGPLPILDLFVPTDAFGNQFLGGTWPTGVPTGFDFYVQYWYFDADMPKNVASTNTVAAVTP